MRYTYLANYCDLTDRAKWERKQKDTRNNLKRFPCGLIESARFLKSYGFSMCYSIIRLLILFSSQLSTSCDTVRSRKALNGRDDL